MTSGAGTDHRQTSVVVIPSISLRKSDCNPKHGQLRRRITRHWGLNRGRSIPKHGQRFLAAGSGLHGVWVSAAGGVNLGRPFPKPRYGRTSFLLAATATTSPLRPSGSGARRNRGRATNLCPVRASSVLRARQRASVLPAAAAARRASTHPRGAEWTAVAIRNAEFEFELAFSHARPSPL